MYLHHHRGEIVSASVSASVIATIGEEMMIIIIHLRNERVRCANILLLVIVRAGSSVPSYIQQKPLLVNPTTARWS